jgi:hypothetical protein
MDWEENVDPCNMETLMIMSRYKICQKKRYQKLWKSNPIR